VKLVALLTLVVAALLAAGTARAGWCGETADAACQPSLAYVECADGTVWVVDPALADPGAFGEEMCQGGYTLLQPPPGDPPPAAAPPAADVGFGADPDMDPDPALYVGEVRCPDGSIWAVARGDDFACPEV
jgi:hypothetical protein